VSTAVRDLAARGRLGEAPRLASLSVLASLPVGPSGGPDEAFRAAGLVDPGIIVPAGARVTIELVNASTGTAHGLVVAVDTMSAPAMPMMSARPAFGGSALWFLGSPTFAGMHAGTITFTAALPGTYRYLCPVPGQAQEGMTGTFTVR
jgi:rusticyanin